MATILNFQPRSRGEGQHALSMGELPVPISAEPADIAGAAAQPTTGQIVFFTGVRYSRWEENEADRIAATAHIVTCE